MSCIQIAVLLIVAIAFRPPPTAPSRRTTALCFTSGDTTYRIAPDAAAPDFRVRIASDPAAPDLRMRLVERPEIADFVLVDDFQCVETRRLPLGIADPHGEAR